MDPLTFDTPDGLIVKVNVPAGTLRLDAVETTTTQVTFDSVKDPKNLEVRLDRVGGAHRLSIEQKGSKFGFSNGKELVLGVRCPLGTRLEMSTGSGDVVAHGRLGGIEFKSGSGDVEFDEVDGGVSVKVGSGDLEGGVVRGDLAMNSASGDIRVRSVGGNVAAKSASGDLEIDAIDGSVTVTSVSGDIRLGSLIGGVTNIRSVSGDVEIGVAQGVAVRLDVHATSGQARSDLMELDGPPSEGRPLELKVLTVSGDIRIRRADARQPVPA